MPKSIRSTSLSLLLPVLAILVAACSKNDGDLALSCYGTNTTTIANQTMSKPENRQYAFVGMKLENNANYDCNMINNTIICYDESDDAQTRKRGHLLHDQSTGSFTEIRTTRVSTNNHLLDRDVFIGRCEKPLFGQAQLPNKSSL